MQNESDSLIFFPPETKKSVLFKQQNKSKHNFEHENLHMKH